MHVQSLGFSSFHIDLQTAIAETKIKIERFIPQFPAPSKSNSAYPCAGPICRRPIHSNGQATSQESSRGLRAGLIYLLQGLVLVLDSSGFLASPWRAAVPAASDPMRLAPEGIWAFFNPSPAELPLRQ